MRQNHNLTYHRKYSDRASITNVASDTFYGGNRMDPVTRYSSMENEYQDRQSVRRNDDYECSLSDSAIESETSIDCRDRGRFSQRSQHS